ncbi:MAG: hypothetical protein JEZ10_00620 [Verrucomicrobia bacterium]|nr:hypothetical protein [Verrucomicrobiota bacterium]
MKSILKLVALLVLAVAFVYGGIWQWGFCRFYVKPNQMAVVTTKSGKPLAAGQILAEKGQKGIQREVLGEGRHFRNPIMVEHIIMPVTIILPGKIGVVTSKVGNELPAGEFLAGPGQKGILRTVLGPGKYRLNPYGYKIDIVDAMSVPIGYAGVITSLSGQQAPPGEFAGNDQKGVRKDILQPGLYYVNPQQYNVDVLEIGVNQVTLAGKLGGQVVTKNRLEGQSAAMDRLQSAVFEEQRAKRDSYISKSSMLTRKTPAPVAARTAAERLRGTQQADFGFSKGYEANNTLGLAEFVEFPSRDGFSISLDMSVEMELLPKDIATIYSRYGDLPALVDKIIMPQITSISRNKGSEYRAKDFIVGEGREEFQNDLTAALAATLGEKSIVVHNALIRHVVVPEQILDPIQQASIAIEQDLTNKERQNTAKKEAELNTEVSLIDQRRMQVEQETRKLKAEINADQEKQVAEIKAETTKRVAEIQMETAVIQADTVRLLAIANANALKLVEGARADGFRLKAEAFKDPVAFTYWEMAKNLNPDLKVNILHAGDGTLWTDLEKATLGDLGGSTLMRK